MAKQWKIGDKIQNRWEIYKTFRGGMGIVYIVYDHHPEHHQVFAAKTFQDEVFSRNPQVAKRFTQESLAWINLDIHENITQAYFVQEIEGKPYIFLEYVSGGDLSPWIGTPRLTNDLTQILRFAIQFCDGMIHANSKGIKAHRDIKPQNCLITEDRTLKITDFGLAKIFENESLPKSIDRVIDEKIKEPKDFFKMLSVWLQEKRSLDEPELEPKVENLSNGLTLSGKAAGTPMYMAPEQFDDAKHVDVRADIYSFGVMLFEMVIGKLPFIIQARTKREFWGKYREAHQSQKQPNLKTENPELDAIIKTCLAKNAIDRFRDFKKLREQLGILYKKLIGEPAPKPKEGDELNAMRLTNKGASLSKLGMHQEALPCFDQALTVTPDLMQAWVNKGVTLGALGKYEEEIFCLNHALEIDSNHVELCLNKGAALVGLKKHEKGIECYDHALAINPHYDKAWINKGVALGELGRIEEAFKCYDRALNLNNRSDIAWHNKGNLFAYLGQHEEALNCFEEALAINPYLTETWFRKSNVLNALERHEEVINCCNRYIELNPYNERAWSNKGNALNELGRYKEGLANLNRSIELNPNFQAAWYNKGNSLYALRRLKEAFECFDRATEFNPKDYKAWSQKGMTLNEMDRNDEAIECYNHALELNPNDPKVWSNKGNALCFLGRIEEAIACYDRAIELKPDFGDAWFNKGVLFAEILGKYEKGIEFYNQAIKVNPKDYRPFSNKGVALINAFQNYKEALTCFEEAHRLGDPYVAQFIELCQQKLGQK